MKKLIAVALIAFVSAPAFAADKHVTVANQTPAAGQPMTVDQCKDELAKCKGDATCEAGVKAKPGCEQVTS